jgi:hypothetical protein
LFRSWKRCGARPIAVMFACVAGKSSTRANNVAPRTRRRQPNDLKNVHDRRTTDLLRNAQVSPIEVDDPLEIGGKLIVMRSTRDDPLADLHAHHRIDEAQYHAGRAFQHDFEMAERGPRAIDPSKEAVDGGLMPEPITEAQRKAARKLAIAHIRLGVNGSAITHDVLIHGRNFRGIATSRGLAGRRWEDHFSLKFRECLDILAELWGFSNGSRSA